MHVLPVCIGHLVAFIAFGYRVPLVIEYGLHLLRHGNMHRLDFSKAGTGEKGQRSIMHESNEKMIVSLPLARVQHHPTEYKRSLPLFRDFNGYAIRRTANTHGLNLSKGSCAEHSGRK